MLRRWALQPFRCPLRAHSCPQQEHPLGLSQCLRATGAAGRVQLTALRASVTSPLPTETVSETGGDVARLLLLPSVQRDVHPGLAALPAT